MNTTNTTDLPIAGRCHACGFRSAAYAENRTPNTVNLALAPRPSPLAPRRAFTLVELMIVIGIIAMLAAMAGLGINNAMEASNVAKTRSLIARLNALLMPRYESYRYRRLPITMPSGLTPQQAAQVRCDALRQLMRMEMPDRWTDIQDNPVALGTSAPASLPSSGNGSVTMPRSAISQAYLAYYTAHAPSGPVFAQAKCLYLLVASGLEDNDVMENFSQSDIKTDTDGWNYFADAWGNPIMLLRWAPGFITQPAGIPASRTTNLPPYTVVSQLQTAWDRDQTDPTGVYGNPASQGGNPTAANTYALYPLIYSAGADGFYGLVADSGTPIHYTASTPPNNPFFTVLSPTANGPIGIPNPDGNDSSGNLDHYDNVHSHLLGTR